MDPSTTELQKTVSPATESPTTKLPTTEPPKTEPPTTEPPTTEPTTQPITTTTERPRACDCAVDVCITATSGASDQCGPEFWSGHDIEILQNTR